MNQALVYLQGIRDFVQRLSLPQKISYFGGLAVFAGALAFLVYIANRTDYSVLYSGLPQSDMGEITQALKSKKIPYRINEGNLEVAREHVYETRLSLAAEGIPKGGGSGFEIFDQQKLGSTEFVQKINYQRALQGELARTINGMNEVQESRVHLVLPEESLFKEDYKPPSAAVVLKLRPGARLDQKQLQGIVNLVAATVRGLEENRITVMSTDGQVLFKKNNPSEQSAQMSNVQLERKQRMEDDMRQKVQSMLEQVIGPNRVLARVNLDLDFNQVQIAEETFNPDSAVIRSQQRSVEASDGKEGAARGNPDAPINTEGKLLQNAPQAEAAKGGKQFNRQREVVNYEINKTSKQIVQMPGNIKKVSVAVIVDGRYENKPGADGKSKLTYVARPPEEMKALDELVKKAVGYSDTRGDQITVSNIPFTSDIGGADMVQGENKWLQMLKSYQRILINLALIFVVLFFVIRPLMRKFGQVAESMKKLPPPVAEPSAEEQMNALLLDRPGQQLSLRKQSMALVKHNPDKATEIIRSWLKDEV